MTTCAVFLTLVTAFACIGRGAYAIIIPPPDNSHQFQVAVAHFPLTDASRVNPFSPNEQRSIMASVFLPVPNNQCSSSCQVAYMPPQTAHIADQQFLQNTDGKSVFGQMDYNVCCASSNSIDASQYPLVILEPQTDTSRLLYANMARFISANGVAVLLLDHPGDSSIVEFPASANLPQSTIYNSGSTKLSNFSPINPWNSSVTSAVSIRVQDIYFALTQISSLPLLQSRFPNVKLTSPLNTATYSIVGHGLGGTVASTFSFTDARTQFSVVLAGTPPPLCTSSNATLYFLGSSTLNRSTDVNWPSTWSHLTGTVSEIDLVNADIFDFADLPVIVELTQNEGKMPAVRARGVGDSGAWANHAAVCFVEGVMRLDLLGNTRGVSDCVDMFASLVPWLGDVI